MSGYFSPSRFWKAWISRDYHHLSFFDFEGVFESGEVVDEDVFAVNQFSREVRSETVSTDRTCEALASFDAHLFDFEEEVSDVLIIWWYFFLLISIFGASRISDHAGKVDEEQLAA